MTYDFSLDRKSSWILGAGSVALVVLVFLCGFLVGMSWRRESQIAATRPGSVTVAGGSPPPTPVASAGMPKGTATPASQETPAPAAPGPEKAAAEPSSPPPTPTFAPAAVTPAPPVAAEQSGVRLAIQVGSFLQKSNAEKLADQLKHSGYNPQIVLADIGARQWNVVRVGPYQDWDEATQVAAQLSRDQTGRAVIRAIR